jgi:hypothetical protein
VVAGAGRAIWDAAHRARGTIGTVGYQYFNIY